MATELRSLRVAPELDAGKYVSGAQDKVAADKAMVAANREVSSSATESSVKISQAGDVLARLSRQYVDGYASAQRFNTALNTLSRGIDTGRIKMSEALPILDGMYRKFGLMADAAQFAARGQVELAEAINQANAKLAAQRDMSAANDIGGARGATGFRRQNLMYQLFDVGQMAAIGQSPALLAMQQGPQIAQLYAMNGGLKALGADLTAIASGAATATMSVIGMTGAVATGFGLAAAAAGAFYLLTRDQSKTLDEALADHEKMVRLIGDAWGYAARQAKAMPIISAQGGNVLAAASVNELRLAIANRSQGLIGELTTNRGAGGSGNQFGPALIAASEFREFSEAIEHLRTTARQGKPDIEGFRELVTQRWSLDPLNQELTTTAGKLLDMTNSAMQAVQAIRQLDQMRAAQFAIYGQYSQSRRAAAGSKEAQDELEARLRADRAGPYGNGIPIPTPRPNDIERLDSDLTLGFMHEFERSSGQQIAQLNAQREAIGLSGEALEAFMFKQQALNAAIAKNIELGPEQIAIIERQAKAYAEAATALARARLGADLQFEREQFFRAPGEQRIAARLRGTGLAMNSPEALQMRELDRMERIYERGMAFWDDFEAGIRRGDDFGKALGDAIRNAVIAELTDIARTAFSNFLKVGIQALFPGMAGSTTSVTGGLAIGGGGIAAAVLGGTGAANDNRISRSPLLAASDMAPRFLSGIGSPGGAIASAGPYSVANATAFIRDYAASIGIDPDIALRVAKSEGLGAGIWQSNYVKNGFREPSYGPFQLLKGGPGTGFGRGLGNAFMAKTGLDPADPANWQQSTAFALDQAKAGGWGPWFGAKKQGITGFMGIDQSVEKATVALDKLSTSSIDTAQSLTGGLGKLGSSLAQATPAAAGGGGGGGLFGWLGGLFGGGGGVLSGIGRASWAGGFAKGTESAPPGWAWVGEEGPELMRLRGGEVIRSHNRSVQMAREGSSAQVVVPDVRVYVDQDGNWQAKVEQIATRPAREESNRAVGSYAYRQSNGGAKADDHRFQRLKRRA